MAEAIGLGASILQIAVFGASVVTALRTLSKSYSSAEQRITDLSSDIALTASILTSLGNTVQDYSFELHFKEDQFRPAKEACDRNFQRLKKALREAKRKDNGKGKGKALSPWDKLMFALGGEDEIKALVVSIETSKSTLQLLLDSVNLLVLKRLSKKHLLDQDQADDLKLLVCHLPSLLKSLQSAGFVNSTINYPGFRDILPEATTVFMHVASNNAPTPRCSPEIPTKTALETSGVGLSASSDHNDKEDTLDNLGDAPAPPESPTTPQTSRGMNDHYPARLEELDPGRDSSTQYTKSLEAPQDSHNVEEDGFDEAKASLEQEIPNTANTKGSHELNGESVVNPKVEDFDTRSCHSSLDDSFIYEGWLLEGKRFHPDPTIVTFCGLKIKINKNNVYKTEWNVRPSTLDREYLRKSVSLSDKDSTNQRVTFLESLDNEAQHEVRELLEDRNIQATKPYSWVLAAIVDDNRLNKKRARTAIIWSKKSKAENREIDPRWMVVLKGGIHEQTPFKSIIPDRYSDPWRTSYSGQGPVHWSRPNSRQRVPGRPRSQVKSADSSIRARQQRKDRIVIVDRPPYARTPPQPLFGLGSAASAPRFGNATPAVQMAHAHTENVFATAPQGPRASSPSASVNVPTELPPPPPLPAVIIPQNTNPIPTVITSTMDEDGTSGQRHPAAHHNGWSGQTGRRDHNVRDESRASRFTSSPDDTRQTIGATEYLRSQGRPIILDERPLRRLPKTVACRSRSRSPSPPLTKSYLVAPERRRSRDIENQLSRSERATRAYDEEYQRIDSRRKDETTYQDERVVEREMVYERGERRESHDVYIPVRRSIAGASRQQDTTDIPDNDQPMPEIGYGDVGSDGIASHTLHRTLNPGHRDAHRKLDAKLKSEARFVRGAALGATGSPPFEKRRQRDDSRDEIGSSPSSPAYSPSASLRSLRWEEELSPEEAAANRAIDEFLGTLVEEFVDSENEG